MNLESLPCIFLEHQVDSSGIQPLQDKVSVIQGFAQPDAYHGLIKFLEMLNFYYHFIPIFATIECITFILI